MCLYRILTSLNWLKNLKKCKANILPIRRLPSIYRIKIRVQDYLTSPILMQESSQWKNKHAKNQILKLKLLTTHQPRKIRTPTIHLGKFKKSKYIRLWFSLQSLMEMKILKKLLSKVLSIFGNPLRIRYINTTNG